MIEMPELARRASTVSGRFIIRDAEVPHLIVHEWERDGVQMVAWPEDGQVAPYDAARIGLKLFNFETGQVRLIDFDNGTRTPWHLCKYQDALFYGLTATQIEFVNEAIHHAHPGDASIHPEHTMHHSETIIGGTRVEFGFAPQGKSGRDLVAIPGRDLTLHRIADRVADGKAVRLWGDEAAGAGEYRAKLFQLPGYGILEAHYPKGHAVALHEAAEEKIVYVISGRLTVTTGDESGEVGVGDCYRIAAGKPFAREALEDVVLIEVDGSDAPWAFCTRAEG